MSLVAFSYQCLELGREHEVLRVWSVKQHTKSCEEQVQRPRL